ncbi:MAG: hypothetical protein IJ605_00565 [Prevotella sp.]|nr:hypothetical protein [Prevotella sp.]
MIKYTKEHIGKLLDRFMDGTSTLEEEDILARFFQEHDVPQEWEEYRLLFQEIDAMKPVSAEIVAMKPENRQKRWLGWSIAAAIVAGGLFLVTPSKRTEQPQVPVIVQADTTTTVSQPEIRTPEAEKDSVSTPKTPAQSPKRSRRKPRPTMLDHDKAYALMAQAEQEQREVERQLAQCQQEIIEAQLASYGYVPVRQEDGTIIYINEQQNLMAYEE